ncbi:hypothetical protein ASPWEDRAFT_167521 [Aspergillus wentii DTO 134E9]|uniref:ER transporter 6TM N-terminal domain-containing protein n=1 Tax=Aspergillus wentii DTO 134E9 TaxID=1073089 RepID=A0A1L9S2Y1_ASPWE|nr:uncharacterized protein ASPWEDRAFT_167521 [Aspergillus wentii DTO 134E9]OJJ41506.1 hypothetical protein ASPWEDRAFT_167521 [Aspergillus wentii DTO 134E9]
MFSRDPSTGKRKVPAWLAHYTNPRELKVWVRCVIASWVASLLMYILPSLRTIGTATFFACFVLFIVPPSGIVSVFILVSLTLLLGMALAWAWGVIVMKAAYAARPAAETQAKLQALGQEAYSQANSTGQSVAYVQQKLIYDGFMLDTRVTVIFFVLICLFIYFLARLRVKNPKFTLVQVFGTIISDLFLAFGPLLPSFSGTLPKLLIEPSAIGIGIGLACSIIFFPQSTSYAVLNAIQDLFNLSKNPVEYTIKSLSDGEELQLADLQKTKSQMIAAYKAVEPGMGFLPIDFSRGRWSADDIKSLQEPIRQTLIATLALLDFHITRVRGFARLEEIRAASSANGAAEKPVPSVGKRQLLENMDMIEAIQSPEAESARSETIEVLREASGEILAICKDVIATAAECIHAVNSRRWAFRQATEKNAELLKKSHELLESLRSVRTSFATETTDKLIEKHGSLFEEDGKLKQTDEIPVHSIRGIMIGMVFEENVVAVADSLDQLLSRIIALLEGRPSPRIWLPTSLRYAAAWIFRQTPVPSIPGQSPVEDPDEVEKRSQDAQHRLQISRGHTVKRRNGAGRAILGLYHWLINAEGMYAMKMVIVTIALGVPAVIPSSAGFYYREKGFWALIMGQTTMLVYMSDFALSVICRTAGTIVGGVLGLIGWYIASGKEDGDPVPLAIVSGAGMMFHMSLRLWGSPAILQGTLMSAATALLVIGYSYDDVNIPAYGNPGVGYNVFWRRLVLVFVGLAASTIVQIFPRPPSAARHICKSLSNAMRSLTDHYALLLSCWGRSDRETGLIAEQISVDMAETLSNLDAPIALLKLEFSSSPFDSKTLSKVKCLCQDLNQNIGRLLYQSASLPPALQTRLSQTTGLLENRSISDIMAVLGVVEQSLKTGDALPELLPTPLVKRCHEFWVARHAGIGLEVEQIREENYRRYCVAVSSYLKVLAAVDELVLVVKGVLGEAHVVVREVASC